MKALPPDNHVENRITQLTELGIKQQQAEEFTDYQVKDATAQLRDVLIDDCLYQAGWENRKGTGRPGDITDV
ncbi:hypothetical protein ACMGOD_004292 [Klebsiella oxytoca]